MFPLLLSLVLASPDVPPVCQAPATRDVGALSTFAKDSGSLSVGLDSVATWCFDSAGGWTGGQKVAEGKSPSLNAAPTGDCRKAIDGCKAAVASMSTEQRTLLFEALGDLDRPFLGMKYTPRRRGLAERPPEVATCDARDRSTLFAQAQARMDLARLASQAQNEYANYKTWLYAEGLKCAQAVARGEKDPLQKKVAVDAPSTGGGTMQVPGTTTVVTKDHPPAVTEPAARDAGTSGAMKVVIKDNPPGTVEPALRDGNGSSLAARPGAPEGTSSPVAASDAGSVPGRTAAAALAGGHALNPDAGAATGPDASAPDGKPAAGNLAPGPTSIPLGGPTAERQRALASSMIDKWRYFLAEQSRIEQDGDWVSGFLASRELRDCRCQRMVPGDVVRRLENKDRVAQLEADDEKNTRCELCLLDAFPPWKTRAVKQCALALELSDFELGVLERSDDGNGLPPRCVEAARSRLAGKLPPKLAQPAPPQQGTGYVITRAPEVPPPDSVKPTDYAPVPAREDGRIYVRVFTSAACVAELLPGPVQARTGDLMPIPPQATEITVRGPCGGFAEVYFGKEEKPRVAETFARNQPLRLQFRAP